MSSNLSRGHIVFYSKIFVAMMITVPSGYRNVLFVFAFFKVRNPLMNVTR